VVGLFRSGHSARLYLRKSKCPYVDRHMRDELHPSLPPANQLKGSPPQARLGNPSVLLILPSGPWIARPRADVCRFDRLELAIIHLILNSSGICLDQFDFSHARLASSLGAGDPFLSSKSSLWLEQKGIQLPSCNSRRIGE
jgi:hypothetical protein